MKTKKKKEVFSWSTRVGRCDEERGWVGRAAVSVARHGGCQTRRARRWQVRLEHPAAASARLGRRYAGGWSDAAGVKRARLAGVCGVG